MVSLFVLGLVRGTTLPDPGVPGATVWTPATRTLSTTALPPAATRRELWRQAAGGAPELLLIGESGALALVAPAEFTFPTGTPYELWLQGRNGRGTSAPGPKQS